MASQDWNRDLHRDKKKKSKSRFAIAISRHVIAVTSICQLAVLVLFLVETKDGILSSTVEYVGFSVVILAVCAHLSS